jgi:hypothetical protein
MNVPSACTSRACFGGRNEDNRVDPIPMLGLRLRRYAETFPRIFPFAVSQHEKNTQIVCVLGRIPDRQVFQSEPYFCHWVAAVFDIMPIRQYLDGERFDPETTRLLGIAFETAIQALHCSGVDHPARETIARAIIGFAKAGERDPERLCDLALATCSKPIISDPSPLPPHASPQAQPDS